MKSIKRASEVSGCLANREWSERSSNGRPAVCVCVFADPFLSCANFHEIPLPFFSHQPELMCHFQLSSFLYPNRSFHSSDQSSHQGSAEVILSPTLTRDCFTMIRWHTQGYLHEAVLPSDIFLWTSFCCCSFCLRSLCCHNSKQTAAAAARCTKHAHERILFFQERLICHMVFIKAPEQHLR